MKKILAVTLILALLMPFAFAEDVKAMSDDELKALYISIQAELLSRGLVKEATLPAGIYTSENGIPEGKYLITSKRGVTIALYSSYEAYLNKERAIDSFYVWTDDHITIDIKSGIYYYFDKETIIARYVGLNWQ